MKIFDSSNVSLQAAQAWALKRGAHSRYINVAVHYWQIAPRYGIPPEIAYAQAGHETGWGKYGGVVSPDFHNWCGLKTRQGGSNDAPEAHQRFPDDATGVLAHIQHLARYAGLQTLPDGDALVDPRWHLVTKFTQDVEGLGGAWAPAASYGQTIAKLAADLRTFANDGTWNMTAQIPGFTWYPADSDHYERGRRMSITGGAQHYTAGTNSLNWLAKTSEPEVSVHFLVKHNPTMEDRGWQLVRIEDTAWTTAFANPYTVAIEYEHNGKQSIPDAAYEVLAQTWIDIDRYCKQHGLGAITEVKGHKEWVNNPQLICPDGIDVDRIVKLIQQPQPSPQPQPTDPSNPWYLHLGGNVMAQYPFRWGFRGVVEGLALQRYPQDPNSAALALVGQPLEDEWKGVDGNTYQRTSKVTLVYTPGNAVPWDVAMLDRDAPLPERAA